MEKKITKATLKMFIRKNKDNLFLEVKSDFDGMVDCVMPCKSPKRKIDCSNLDFSKDCWGLDLSLVGGDKINKIKNGFEVKNCCGKYFLTNQ